MLKKLSLILITFFLIINIWWIKESNAECTWTNCINKTSFSISTEKLWLWWHELIKNDTEATVNNILWTIIQKLMIGLGSVAFLIMTIWAWFMILYHGQDELLSKWKYIFMSWIIALVVALSSYYIVSLLRYLLYA